MSGREGVVPAAVWPETSDRIFYAIYCGSHNGCGECVRCEHPAPRTATLISAGLQSEHQSCRSILKIVVVGIMERRDGAVSDRMDIRVKVRPDLAIQNQTFSCKKKDDKGEEYVFCARFMVVRRQN